MLCLLVGEAQGHGRAEQVGCVLTAAAASRHILLMCLAELVDCLGGG